MATLAKSDYFCAEIAKKYDIMLPQCLVTTSILSRKLDTANKYYESAFALDGKELILMVSDKADVIKKIFLHAPSRRTFVSSKLTSAAAADDPSVSQSWRRPLLGPSPG